MKGKSGSHNRFLRILALPLRCLTRTRDCYVSGMSNYAVVNPPKPPGVQRSYSVSSSGDSEDFRELLKAASTRGMESRIELDRLMQQYMRQMRPVARSSSAAAMGRIEEETTGVGDLQEDGAGIDETMNKFYYPRSKSYAVVSNKRTTPTFGF